MSLIMHDNLQKQNDKIAHFIPVDVLSSNVDSFDQTQNQLIKNVSFNN